MKITRRKFLYQSVIGALGLAIAPGILAATAKKAPAAVRTNPLFTGALGRYEGVNIVHTPGSGMMPYDDRMFLSQVRDAHKYGSGWSKIKPVKIEGKDYYIGELERVAFNDLFRRGQPASKRRG
jgi:hypothetical protein